MAPDALDELLGGWLADAETCRSLGAAPQAVTLERCVEDVRRFLRRKAGEVLTLEEAANESGYAKRTIRKMVADGTVPNAGRKNAPRVRRGDLPRKPAAARDEAGSVVSIDAEARRLAALRA